MRVLVILLLLAAGAGRAEGPHIAVGAGAGVAYGGAGAHLEVIASHFGIFGGVGYDLRAAQAPAYCAGLRVFSGAGSGATLSLNFAYLSKHLDVAPAFPVGEYTNLENVYLGATIGWRAVMDLVFLEAGIGPAWLRARSKSTADPPFGAVGCSGTFPRTCDARRVTLDLSAAIGVTF